MDRRHVEFFGPDLARGPFASSNPETAAVQIATALAQLRFPLLRSDADITAHCDFIRQLADRLYPDAASFVTVDIGPENFNAITCQFRTAVSGRSVLRLWLADAVGGGVTTSPPNVVEFLTGTVLETIVDRGHYVVLSDSSGVISVSVASPATATWRWGVGRGMRAFFSGPLSFT